MHYLIDYIPWPILVLILLGSIFILIKFFILNKKFGVQLKVGGLMLIFGGLGMILEKIAKEISLNIKYYNLLEHAAIPTLTGFLVLYGGIIKEVDNIEQKKILKKYLIAMIIAFSLLGMLAYYPF